MEYQNGISVLFMLENINNPINQQLVERCSIFNEETGSVLKQMLFNIHDYKNSLELGYGLSSFYVLKFAEKRNRNLCFLFTILFLFLFGFQGKYIILIVSIVLEEREHCFLNRKAMLILCVLILDCNWTKNTSLQIIVLFEIYTSIDSPLSFKAFLCLLQSQLFGSVNFLSLLIFPLIVLIKSILFIFSFVLLGLPELEAFYMSFVYLFSEFMSSFSFSLNGSLSTIFLIFYIAILLIVKIKNEILQMGILAALLISPFNHPYACISFIDVGQGDAILFDGLLYDENILLDTGSSYNFYKLNKYLNKKGIREIDTLIITHNDEDHNGNMSDIIENYHVKNIVLKGKDIVTDSFSLKFHELASSDNDNDNSLVYSLNKNGMNFLFTGDISSLKEMELLKVYTEKTDVLKVSHHGSSSAGSQRFLSSILPQFSIISTNGQYGHPSQETVNNLSRYGSTILITRDEGDIEFYFIYDFVFIITKQHWFVII